MKNIISTLTTAASTAALLRLFRPRRSNLAATVLGLCIAIPALVGAGYLQRKIDNYAAQLDVLLERILQRSKL